MQKAKDLGFLCLLAHFHICWQNGLGRGVSAKQVFKVDAATGFQWLKTKNGPSNPASTQLNPVQHPGAATSLERWEKGLPTTCPQDLKARRCPATALRLHRSQGLVLQALTNC